MGQVLSIIWNWLFPPPKEGSKGKADNDNDNPSHLIIIPDHPQPSKTKDDHDHKEPSFSSTSNDGNKNCKQNGKIRKGMYDSTQRILLVGEGDFSFSACLAIAFHPCASNIVATSLNSRQFLMKNYNNFPTNEVELRSRGALVMHDIDATKMAKHPKLAMMKFDRIIFNFPHTGFNHASSESELRSHQALVTGFLKNAKKMIEDDGEIHVTHKSNPQFLKWDIQKLGADEGLDSLEAVDFKHTRFPGYGTKYGFGGDKNFHCNPSKTYKFALSTKK